jgi:hypothetical protein
MSHRPAIALTLTACGLLALLGAGCAQDGSNAAGSDAGASAAATSVSPLASGATAASTVAPNPEAARRYVTVMKELAALFDGGTNDCAALADALKAFREKNAETLDTERPKIFPVLEADPALKAELRGAMNQILTGTMKCKGDPAFARLKGDLRMPAPGPN